MLLREINWGNGLFLIGYHLLVLIGLPWYALTHVLPLGMIGWAIALVFLTLISVTTTYHRLYSHKTFTLNTGAQAVLLFFSTLALQNSVLVWAHEHRRHHAHVDTDQDPYSIKKGFWYAHMLWMFKKSKGVDESLIKDLTPNPLLRFQHKYYLLLAISTNAVVWAFFGWVYDNYMASFFLIMWGRLFFSHHITWMINSAAHTWGTKQFSKEHSAADNYVLSIITCGEGYHNYHHTFPSDYRNGVHWYQFDTTKWLIWTLHKCGFATDLKRIRHYTVKARIIREEKDILLEKIRKSYSQKKEAWTIAIAELSDRIHMHTTHLHELYEELKQKKADKKEAKRIRLLLKLENGHLRKDWKVWCGLFSTLMTIQSA